MTNLHLAILSTVLTLAILGALWEFYRRLKSHLSDYLVDLFREVQHTERSLRSHVVDEVDSLSKHISDHALQAWEEAGETEGRIIDYIKAHFEDLRKHAEDLRNHAKELSDRAEVQASPPRQAVTRN